MCRKPRRFVAEHVLDQIVKRGDLRRTHAQLELFRGSVTTSETTDRRTRRMQMLAIFALALAIVVLPQTPAPLKAAEKQSKPHADSAKTMKGLKAKSVGKRSGSVSRYNFQMGWPSK